MKLHRAISFLLSVAFCINVAQAQRTDSTKAGSQNPSPMTEDVRKHGRIEQKEYPGLAFEIANLFTKPLQVFVPQRSQKAKTFDLLIHFNGAAFVTEYAAQNYNGHLIGVTLNIGAGSQVYNDAFVDSARFIRMVDTIVAEACALLHHTVKLRRVILSGFSAGYGAIRRIISSESNYKRVDAVLLLDGIHASYVPERRVIAEGGRIDSAGVLSYVNFARDAASRKSRKRFLITHSEIFPGIYASTTEATDFILRSLSTKRVPVLNWGPVGMQQISAARKNHFAVMGFAGNTARDHVDHLHGISWFLNRLLTF